MQGRITRVKKYKLHRKMSWFSLTINFILLTNIRTAEKCLDILGKENHKNMLIQRMNDFILAE